MRKKREYWLCIVGPVDGTTLELGADFPMRMGIRSALERLEKTGLKVGQDFAISSGWGIDDKTAEEIKDAWNKS